MKKFAIYFSFVAASTALGAGYGLVKPYSDALFGDKWEQDDAHETMMTESGDDIRRRVKVGACLGGGLAGVFVGWRLCRGRSRE